MVVKLLSDRVSLFLLVVFLIWIWVSYKCVVWINRWTSFIEIVSNILLSVICCLLNVLFSVFCSDDVLG